MKKLWTRLLALLAVAAPAYTAYADVSYYECADLGFISATHKTVAGTVATTNKGTEILLVKDNGLQKLVSSPGAGMYTTVSKDGKLVGFKKIDNLTGRQAPAVLDAATGAVRMLEDYSRQCGQVSFADDGTMAYTVGNDLIIRKGDTRSRFSLGLYTNIANISPDGSKVAYCDLDGNSYILTVATGAIEKFAETGGYRPIWSPDSKKIAMHLINGAAVSYDSAAKTLYPLGEANSLSWADNSQDLVVSRSERINDLQVKGASVVMMNYKGVTLSVLEELTESTPVSAQLDGNTLTISYAAGEQRGLTAKTYSGAIRAGAPAKVRTIFKAGKQRIGAKEIDNFMGKVRPDYSKMSKEEAEAVEAGMDGNSLKAPMRKGNDIGLTSIPYINQVWDTPACGGSAYAYGYICCAPTSSCMMLAWYGKFRGKEVWTASRHGSNPAGGTNYSWFVSKEYQSVTGYTFNKYLSGQGGNWGYSNNVAGGYGYMWGYGSPASMMANFHKYNGAKNSWYESSWGVLQRECNANRPYVICLANGTGGHVVTVFRSDQIAANDGSSAWGAGGTFICHDPYGDYNGSSYPNWDGRYSSYDWPGINNGRANIGAFYWGCVTESDGANPVINVSTTYANLSCDRWEHPYCDINVSTDNITENISVWADSQDDFTISTGSLGSGGGSFRITFKNTDWYHYKGTWVHVRANNVQKDIHVEGYVQGAPLPELSESWNNSAQRGTASSKGYDATKIRNFCYLNGKLYCVYRNARIIVLNAQTGDKLGELKLNGVGEGTLALTDVKAISGKIVACNLATTANNNSFRIYKWDSDDAEPKVILNTKDFQGVDRIGDCLEVVGTLDSDAWFCFIRDNGCNDTRVVEYHQIGEYTFEPKYTLAFDANGNHLHCGATARAYPKGGPYWIDGNQMHPTYCTWQNGKGVSPSVVCSTEGQTQGGSHHEFYYHGWKYAANLVFRGSANYTGGKIRIMRDRAGDFTKTDEKREYPGDGLGGAANSGGTGDVIVNTNEADFCEAWVLSTEQGLAYFRTGSVPTHDVGPINKPEIWFSERDPEMRGKVGETTTKTIRLEARNTSGKISISASDNDGGRSTGVLSVYPTELNGSGDVTITYNPSEHSVNWIWLTASTSGLDPVYCDVHAESYKDPTVTYEGDNFFSTTADSPQTRVFNIAGRDLKGWIGSGIWGENTDHNSQFSAWNDWGLDPNTTVYFDNNKAGWDKVYVWMWNKDNADYNYLGVDYPGIQLTDRGDGIYAYTFTPESLGDNIGILYNNGLESDGKKRQQTDDGHVMNGARYWAAGSSAFWRVPGHKVPLMCEIDGRLTVTYKPNQVGEAWSNFFIASDGMPKNLDVTLHGVCTGLSGVEGIGADGNGSITVRGGILTVNGMDADEIVVYNLSGAKVAAVNGTNTLNISHLPASAYIVTAKGARGAIRAKLAL